MVGLHHGLNAHEFEMVKDREARGAAVQGSPRVSPDGAAEQQHTDV